MSKPRLKFKPKYDKIVELLLYLSHKRPNADHYQAVKLLYLADREHLNRYGRPITYERYCALKYGPVSSNALDLLKKQQDSSVFERFGIDELPFETEQLDKIIYIRTPKRAVNHELFSISDLKVFDEVIQKYGDYNFDQLFHLTHKHFAYKNAWENRGNKQSVDIKYEDMIDENSDKSVFIEEIAPISDHMQ